MPRTARARGQLGQQRWDVDDLHRRSHMAAHVYGATRFAEVTAAARSARIERGLSPPDGNSVTPSFRRTCAINQRSDSSKPSCMPPPFPPPVNERTATALRSRNSSDPAKVAPDPAA